MSKAEFLRRLRSQYSKAMYSVEDEESIELASRALFQARMGSIDSAARLAEMAFLKDSWWGGFRRAIKDYKKGVEDNGEKV
jgi:hypothetical protein